MLMYSLSGRGLMEILPMLGSYGPFYGVVLFGTEYYCVLNILICKTSALIAFIYITNPKIPTLTFNLIVMETYAKTLFSYNAS